MTIHISQYYRDTINQDVNYLINTSKAVKGHKITQKDNMMKMLMKSKNTQKVLAPKKTGEKQPEQKSQINKFTQYTQKYRVFDTIEEPQDLAKFVMYQRDKHSRQSQRKLKLFSRASQRPQTSTASRPTRLQAARAAKTSHTSRSVSSHPEKSIEVHNSLQDKSGNQEKIRFQSDNLNERMNQYLNLILQKKDREDINIIDQDFAETEDELRGKKEETSNNNHNIRSLYKNLASNFYRKMKKQKSSVKNSTTLTPQSSIGSEELVKRLQRQRLARTKYLHHTVQHENSRSRNSFALRLNTTRLNFTKMSQRGKKSMYDQEFLTKSPQIVSTAHTTARR